MHFLGVSVSSRSTMLAQGVLLLLLLLLLLEFPTAKLAAAGLFFLLVSPFGQSSCIQSSHKNRKKHA